MKTRASLSAARLGAHLRSLREAAGVTVAAVAAACDVDPTTIECWGLGARVPKASHLRPLARVLGVKADDLVPALGRPVRSWRLSPAECAVLRAEADALPPSVLRAVPGTLRALRQDSPLGSFTIGQAAARAGVAVELVQRWEDGEVPESLPDFLKYLETYFRGHADEMFTMMEVYFEWVAEEAPAEADLVAAEA